jgi:hypothetical protein
LIRNHQFHSRWWGEPVGVIDDVAFLSLPREQRERQLREYAWVELRTPLHSADRNALAAAGFIHADTQIPFRLGIRRVTGGASIEPLEVTRASDDPFKISSGDVASFTHERFRHLPGVTAERIAERFAWWAADEIAAAPEWCLRVTSGERTQGWFLSHVATDGLHLELAMLHRDAKISGVYLYRRALVAYASFGATIGLARFSVENTPVLNIYASLGAQFLPPIGIWLWTR